MSAKCLPGLLSLSLMPGGFAAVLSAQQKPEDLLVDFRHKLMETVGRLPKYMCTQTVERYRYQSARPSRPSCDHFTGNEKLRLATTDRLCLDVAVTANQEIYSWVRENRFDDRGLFDLIRDGAISTGSFAGFLTSIFGGDNATFSYNGDTRGL